MTNQNNNNIFDTSQILSIAIDRKWLLLSVCIIAIVVSSIVSLLITPKYKSTHILFPVSSASISQSLIAESHGKKDIFKFGEEEDVEQLMQILLSNNIRNKIIEKYDLFNHYEINENSKYPLTNLYRTYDRNIKISRTEFMSIKIDVLDKCPETAAMIANDISELSDSTIRNIRKERIGKAYVVVNREFENQQAKIKEIEDSLKALSLLGIIDVRSQSEVYSDQYAAALVSGNISGAERIKEKIRILEKHGSSFIILKEKMFEEVKKLTQIETKYVEAKIDLEEDLPNRYVVNYAEIPEKKAYPIRWLIVVVSVISTFLFSILILMFFTRVEANKKKKLTIF